MTLSVLQNRLAICRLSPDEPCPGWAHLEGGLSSITRTADELSVICDEDNVPGGVRCEKGWRALKLEGPFALDEVGVLLPIADALARGGISMLTVATFDTDYFLINDGMLARAVERLTAAGYNVVGLGESSHE